MSFTRTLDERNDLESTAKPTIKPKLGQKPLDPETMSSHTLDSGRSLNSGNNKFADLDVESSESSPGMKGMNTLKSDMALGSKEYSKFKSVTKYSINSWA